MCDAEPLCAENNGLKDIARGRMGELILYYRSFKIQQEILHILTIPGKQITHALALAIKNSQILMFSRITFQKMRKFDYYFRFPSFCFLEGKPLDFIRAS